MQSITSVEMAALDENCEHYGLARTQLMENAGAALARIIEEKYPKHTPITIFAGRGNNGGDAFVSARHLTDYETKVFLLGEGSRIKTLEAQKNYSILKKSNARVIEITDSAQIPTPGEGVIIDAIFGTGIKGSLRPLESTAIDRINESASQVISIDVPSGLDPDTGIFQKSVRANLTVTFHKPKPALNNPQLKEYTGEVITVPIGIPRYFEFLLGPGDISGLSRRRAESHKGESGKILVIGGGPYSGAPALCATAALRCGADLVHVAAPKSVAGTIASFSPNLIVTPLTGSCLNEKDLPALEKMIMGSDVVVMGMGLGRHNQTRSALQKIIPLCKKAVIDADALYALDFEEKNYDDIIITPHQSEFSRITGLALPDDSAERRELVMAFAKQSKTTVLLKGKEDIISTNNTLRINITGNSGMTVGGTGDVLAGITAALYATNDSLLATSCAAYINGRAGDIAYGRYGNGLTATDIIECIPDAVRPA